MMLGTRDEFLYFQCLDCQCLQIAEVPADLSKYYKFGYYSFSEHKKGLLKGLKGWITKRSVRHWAFKSGPLDKLLSYFSPQAKYKIFEGFDVDTSSRILDVGCGDGRKFLYPLAAVGFNNLLGCDPFLDSEILYENGLQIFKGDIFAIKSKQDIITFHHSFEHVTNPYETLKKAAELLDSDGLCIIRIPTASSYAWELYRTDWVQLDAPRHIFVHSTKSISLLAEAVGLKLIKTDFDSSHFQFTASEKYRKGIPLRVPEKRGVLDYLKYKWRKRRFRKMAKKLNQEGRGDQAIFYFKKQ